MQGSMDIIRMIYFWFVSIMEKNELEIKFCIPKKNLIILNLILNVYLKNKDPL